MVLPSPHPILLPYCSQFNPTAANELLDILLAHFRRLPNLRLSEPHSDWHPRNGRHSRQRNGRHLHPTRNYPRGRYRHNPADQDCASCLRVDDVWCSNWSVGISESSQDPENCFSCLNHDLTNGQLSGLNRQNDTRGVSYSTPA